MSFHSPFFFLWTAPLLSAPAIFLYPILLLFSVCRGPSSKDISKSVRPGPPHSSIPLLSFLIQLPFSFLYTAPLLTALLQLIIVLDHFAHFSAPGSFQQGDHEQRAGDGPPGEGPRAETPRDREDGGQDGACAEQAEKHRWHGGRGRVVSVLSSSQSMRPDLLQF